MNLYLGDIQSALVDYNQALTLQPDFASASFQRGIVKVRLGDLQGAVTDFNQSIALKPDHADAYRGRATAKWKLGDSRGALADSCLSGCFSMTQGVVWGVPRPGFPKTVREFQLKFATEEACQQYLVACRWPDGFVCPRCGQRRAYELTTQRRWQCAVCRRQVSLTAGTILHNTKTPLMIWFWAAYLMTTDTRGLSALLLQRQLGLRRYETAWMMLHKFRRAMVNLTREPLRGEVEVAETWVGGTQAGLQGSRQLRGRKAALVIVAVERRGRASGRSRMAVIPDVKSETLISFHKQNVAPGTTVYTDGLTSFSRLQAAGFKHVARPQPLRTDRRTGAESVVPLADRAIGNLKQWLIGTHHGVSRDHLQGYLDECVFRYNRRKQPMAAFQTLLGLGTGRAPTGYDHLRGGKSHVVKVPAER